MLAVGVTSLLLMGGTLSVFAASDKVEFKKVDSNEFTFMIKVKKELTMDKASATITKFYNAEGKPTDKYDELYVQCGKDGGQADPVHCYTGKPKPLTLKGTNNKKGTTLAFYAMGYDPKLDCYIDAKFNADVTN